MMMEREETRRSELRRLGEELIAISEDVDIKVAHVGELIHSSMCSTCESYADDVRMEVIVIYER